MTLVAGEIKDSASRSVSTVLYADEGESVSKSRELLVETDSSGETSIALRSRGGPRGD